MEDNSLLLDKIKAHKYYYKTRIFTLARSRKFSNANLIPNALKFIEKYLDGKAKKNISPAINSKTINNLIKNIN